MKFRFPLLYWDRKLHILKVEDDYLLLVKKKNECQYMFHNISYYFYYIWVYFKDNGNYLLAFILLPSKNKVKRAFEDIFVCIPAAVNHDVTLN